MDTREVVTPDTMPLERLEAEITTLAGHLAAGECRWLQLIAEYDRRGGWEQWGCHSAVQWLGWHCGLDGRAAREKLRVGHALVELPLITEEFAAGRLSYSKVRALTRIATPMNEADLVMLAQHATAAQVDRIVSAYRGVLSVRGGGRGREPSGGGAVPARRTRRTTVRLVIHARMPAEVGVLVVKATRRRHARSCVPTPAGRAVRRARPEPRSATNVDALRLIGGVVPGQRARGAHWWRSLPDGGERRRGRPRRRRPRRGL